MLWYSVVKSVLCVQSVGRHSLDRYGTVWWKVLCVLVCGKAFTGQIWYSVVKSALCFGLWKGIYWTDQFGETRETAQWWETFPLSLWWEFRSETWTEKTYWKTAWSKIVIWSVQVSCNVTHWHSSTSSWRQSSLQQDCLLNSQIVFEVAIFCVFYFIYFLCECVLQKYSLLQNSDPQLVYSNYFRSNVQYN